MPDVSELRIPKALRRDAEQIFAFTDEFCAEELDEEYGELCRRLVARLARKRPSPLARGDLRVWAAAVIYTVGQLNFLFDRSQVPHMTGDQLSALTGVAKSTMANKAKLIRDQLKLAHFDIDFCRRELLERHPTAWLIQFDGFIVDARAMPPHIQAEARRRRLIPDLPATMSAAH
ncbi:MAG: DUF6398 domain-containing protein [Acidimicrobiales bacterium]